MRRRSPKNGKALAAGSNGGIGTPKTDPPMMFASNDEGENASGAGGEEGAKDPISRMRCMGTTRRTGKKGSITTGGGAAQAVSETAYRVVVRAAPMGSPSRPLAGQRFRVGPRIWQIEAVREYDPAVRYLICFVKEEVAA